MSYAYPDTDELEDEDDELPAHADLAAARSWIKKFVKDVYELKYGLVHEVVEDGGTIRLLARFPGESESRRIALEPVSDGHYLYPKDAKARYRRLSETDLEQLRQLAGRRSS